MSSNRIGFLLWTLLVTTGLAQLQELNENDKSKIVNRHLQYRRSVRSSNMKVLTWSNKLQSLASSYIESCPLDVSSLDGRVTEGEYGYNFGTTADNKKSSSSNTNDVSIMIIDNWGVQRRFFQLNNVATRPVGNWVQLVWANSNKIGCAQRECGRGTVIMLCLYNGKADRRSLTPYIQGKACSACAEGYMKCERNLCVPEMEEPDEAEPFAEAVEPSREPDVTRSTEDNQLGNVAGNVDPRLRQAESTTTSSACTSILSCNFLILLIQLYL